MSSQQSLELTNRGSIHRVDFGTIALKTTAWAETLGLFGYMVFRITYKHSAMAPDYVGAAIKYAHTAEDACKLLAKGGRWDKKNQLVTDKQRNTLTILNIEKI